MCFWAFAHALPFALLSIFTQKPVRLTTQLLNIELPYDAAILLLGTYLEKTIIQKDTCTLVFTAVLFTIARRWKQPKCPWTDDG